VIFRLPLPFFTCAEGVLWAPEDSRIHANADGFVAEIMTPPGTAVKKGAPLLRCENPELETEVRVLEARLRELEAKHRMSERADVTEAEILKDEMERVRTEVLRARERASDLLLLSPVEGSFVLPDAQDLLRRFVKRGTPLGYVIDFSRMSARVVVPQSQVDLIRRRTVAVAVRIAEDIPSVISSSIIREVPGASNELPSVALSLDGGGKIALDPRAPEGPKAFETLFQFEVALPGVPVDMIGGRVFVRFKHDPEPLAWRWSRAIRRIFLSRFDI
jgi:putative peptide zinc metalloprotease protein